MTDQTAKLQVALDGGQEDFLGETYELWGQVTVPRGAKIRNLRATVPNWDVNRRVFYIPDATDIEIENLSIDIGSDPSKGALSSSQALEIAKGRGFALRKIEVTGKGRGAMVRVMNARDAVIDDIYIHDCQHDATGGGEQIIGLWLLYCRSAQINRPFVSKLLSSASDRPYQTDGITFSGCIDCDVNNPDIYRTGEGVDFTGSLANIRCRINGGVIIEADSFAVKFANAAQACEANGVLAMRAGYAGFEISGQSEAGNAALCYGNKFVDCEARDTCVGNSYWAAQNTAGVRIEQGSYLTAYPSGNEAVNFKAISAAAKYGALTQTNSNKLINPLIVGATVAPTSGTWLS